MIYRINKIEEERCLNHLRDLSFRPSFSPVTPPEEIANRF